MQLIGKQNIAGLADTIGTRIDRQTIPGYTLVNACFQYKLGRHITLQTSVSNLLNQQYKTSGWDMDYNHKPTELFYGADQDPVRVSVGVNFHF